MNSCTSAKAQCFSKALKVEAVYRIGLSVRSSARSMTVFSDSPTRSTARSDDIRRRATEASDILNPLRGAGYLTIALVGLDANQAGP